MPPSCCWSAGRRRLWSTRRPLRRTPSSTRPTASRSSWPTASPRSVSPCRWRCCPTVRCCTPRATARSATPTPTATPRSRDHPGLHPRRGGSAGHQGRPRTSPRNRWVYLYYAPPLSHPGRRRAGHRHRGDFDPFDGRQPAVPVHAERRRHARPGQRGDRPRRADRPGHVLPRRRRHRLRRGRQPVPDHRRRHQPVRLRPATRRSTSGPTATRRSTRSAPRATPTTCAARCCGSSRTRPAAYTDPGRQHVRARHGQHPARDLRDGLPQPVPDERRQGHRRRLPRRLRPGRRHRRRHPGPGGQVEFDRITAPGFYGWPYCTGTNTTAETYNEYTFPTAPTGAKYNCAGGPTNNSLRNTGLTHAAGRPPGLDPLRRRRRLAAGVRQRLGVADGRPGLPLRRRAPLGREVPRRPRRALLRR